MVRKRTSERQAPLVPDGANVGDGGGHQPDVVESLVWRKVQLPRKGNLPVFKLGIESCAESPEGTGAGQKIT